MEWNGWPVCTGIRNDKEVEYFQSKYPDFYLVALHAPMEKRWLRCKEDYDGNQKQFELDDERDQEEDIEHGQQIRKCVELADLVLRNEEHWDPPSKKEDYQKKFCNYIRLLVEPFRAPTPDEFNMHVAHSIRAFSSCLKRHVGAVITTPDYRNIISWGYNEVPFNSPPCYSAYGKCYRDIKIIETFREKNISYCPLCGEKLNLSEEGLVKASNFRVDCPKCNTNLLTIINPTKILDYCRALHAEENAIVQTSFSGGQSLHGKVLYSTTFPCNLCAKKIANSGIGEVVYIEPYPMKEAEDILKENNVRTREFEGVKAQAYYKVFKDRRRFLIKTIIEKQGKEGS